MRRTRTLTLLAALTLLPSLTRGEELVTAKDKEVALKATSKSKELCADRIDTDDIDREGGRKALETASGDNVILQAMKESKSNSELGTKMGEKLSVGFMIGKGGAMGLSFVLIFVFSICCWTACCKCCRVCKRQRQYGKSFKLALMVAILGLCLGILIAASTAQAAFNKSIAGFEETNCASAKLVDTTFNGVVSPPFMGMLPVLTNLKGMSDSFTPGSAFLNQLNKVLDDTKSIDQANTLAIQTLTLLKDMSSNSQNKRPKDTSSQDLYHDCTLCTTLEASVGTAIDALKGGMGEALNNARSEVKTQLSGPMLTDLKGMMQTATKPLSAMKDLVRSAFTPMVETDGFTDFINLLKSMGMLAGVSFILLALLISGCGCSGLTCWTFREKTTGKNNESEVRYRASTHRFALCTWCWGFCYAIFALLIGGLITALAVPLSSVCLIMDGLSSQMIADIGPALNVDLVGDQGTMLKSLVDQCFNNPDKNANPVMLDFIFTNNGTHKVTMRDRIVTNTKDKIGSKFAAIGSNGGSVTLNNNAAVVKLKTSLNNSRMDGMMIPDSSKAWNQDATYKDMALDTAAGDSLFTYTTSSSAACADFSYNSVATKGINTFGARLTTFGTPATSTTCARQVTCTGSGNQRLACNAGNAFMLLKHKLRSQQIFKCRKFYKGNAYCDISNMAETSSGVYSNDCFKSDGTLEAREYSCDLNEFTTLVKSFSGALNKVFDRLDKATASSQTKISVDMKKVVDDNVVNKITAVADGLTCGFLGTGYRGVIDGMCFMGVTGFATVGQCYVAVGCLVLFLIILMYIVWRISVDNYNSISSTDVKVVDTCIVPNQP